MPTPIAIAVVEQNNHFLIGQRPPGVALAGYWEFPGGKIEPGESPTQAAARECLEETGIQVEVTSCYLTHTETYDHAAVELHFLACHPHTDSAPPKPPYRWIPRERLPDYRFPAGNRLLLAHLLTKPTPTTAPHGRHWPRPVRDRDTPR